jgi:hypothetical protein
MHKLENVSLIYIDGTPPIRDYQVNERLQLNFGESATFKIEGDLVQRVGTYS